MPTSSTLRNRLGFVLIGLTNNFSFNIMLSAAFDLLDQLAQQPIHEPKLDNLHNSTSTYGANASTSEKQGFCHDQSTSAILLADTLPSLVTQMVYPFVLVAIPMRYKVLAISGFSAASFLITGFSTSHLLIYTGVVCASLSSGLGESTYVSNTPLYGDSSLSGWAMGTGAAGLFGSITYALLRMVLTVKCIMILMLIAPVTMLISFFFVIEKQPTKPNEEAKEQSDNTTREEISKSRAIRANVDLETDEEKSKTSSSSTPNYGSTSSFQDNRVESIERLQRSNSPPPPPNKIDLREKLKILISVSNYFFPLFLVYYAEYFINQGLVEFIYYPEAFLDHAAQYRWLQVAYQLGVMISRSSLDLFKIKGLWSMSLLQVANMALFLVHVSKLFHIFPSFYLVFVVITYEGLLGGFTYVNTFFRLKKELAPERQEVGISTVSISGTLGIVMAGLTALPVHDSLCGLYKDL